MNTGSTSPVMDICIICAIPVEAKALLRVLEKEGIGPIKKDFSIDKWEYRHTHVLNNNGESLRVLVTWLPRHGGMETVMMLQPFLNEFRPRFVAMTGICAGDREKVFLGDLIIAERAFFYDTGKVVTGKDNKPQRLFDTYAPHPSAEIVQYASKFDQWEEAVRGLLRPLSKHQQRDWLLAKLLRVSRVDDIDEHELESNAPDWMKIVQELQQGKNRLLSPQRTLIDRERVKELRFQKTFPFRDPPAPQRYVAPIASGSAVHADNPFAEIRVPMRGVIALDMEGAAFYRAMENFPHIRFLLVKGVSDYADSEKDDSYQDYASEVSARYMLAFIKEYVNQRLMPGAYSEPASKQKKAAPVMSARPAKVAEVAKPAGVQSIMYIYAPEDEKFCTELEKYLNPLRRERLLWSYYDQSIRPGELTQEKIEQRLHDADIILPIITPDLMNNQQFYDQLELAWQERARGAKFIPIIVKRVDGWEQSKFHKLMSLPRDQRLIPINSVSKREQALYDIAKEIRAIVTK